MNQAKVNSNLVNKLRYNFDHKSPRPKRTGGGLKESIGLVKKTLTALIKYERVELNLNRALWTRGYVDRVRFMYYSEITYYLNCQQVSRVTIIVHSFLKHYCTSFHS